MLLFFVADAVDLDVVFDEVGDADAVVDVNDVVGVDVMLILMLWLLLMLMCALPHKSLSPRPAPPLPLLLLLELTLSWGRRSGRRPCGCVRVCACVCRGEGLFAGSHLRRRSPRAVSQRRDAARVERGGGWHMKKEGPTTGLPGRAGEGEQGEKEAGIAHQIDSYCCVFSNKKKVV